jgi:hypothetical protein
LRIVREEIMQPLLHIGYHKTGTTWLQKHLFPNEAAGCALVAGYKLLQPTFVTVNPFDFSPEAARKMFERRIREVEAHNIVPVLSHERLSGSPYTGGYDSGTTADRLAATFPDARILVVIREQAGMIGSVYKQYVRWGGAASFDQYVTPPSGTARMPVFRFDFLEYHRLIGYYQNLFGASKVLTLPYELLRAQPEAFLARVGDFLGIPNVVPKDARTNVSPSILSLSIKRQLNHYFVRDTLNPAPLLEIKNSNRILLKICRRIDATLSPRLLEGYEDRWRHYVKEKVGDRYAKSNAITKELIGIDLKPLGYACD